MDSPVYVARREKKIEWQSQAAHGFRSGGIYRVKRVDLAKGVIRTLSDYTKAGHPGPLTGIFPLTRRETEGP